MLALGRAQSSAGGGDDEGGADRSLVDRLKRGDAGAFSALAERHHDMVYRVAFRMLGRASECEDVVQETFVRLWTNPRQIRDGQALRAWLMRVASNLAIDRLRRRPMLAADQVPEPASETSSPELAIVRSAVSAEIDRAIAALPDRQRAALAMVYFEGLSNRDAAGALEVSVDALESLLARARRGLKELLKDHWQDLLAEIERLG